MYECLQQRQYDHLCKSDTGGVTVPEAVVEVDKPMGIMVLYDGISSSLSDITWNMAAKYIPRSMLSVQVWPESVTVSGIRVMLSWSSLY